MLRRFFSVVAVLSLLCIVFTSVVLAQSQTGIALKAANLRAGPGTNYNIIGKVTPGQVLIITGANASKDWYQLDGGAWIAAFLVKITGSTTAPAAQPVQPPAPSTPTAKNTANLRTGPSKNYAIAGSVTAGQQLNIIGRNYNSTWYQLDSGAWINATLVSNAPSNLPEAIVTEQPAAQPAAPAAIAPAAPAAPAVAAEQCDPNYSGACIPIVNYDLDCGDIPFRRFQVVGVDHHRFDGDHDGIGCEK